MPRFRAALFLGEQRAPVRRKPQGYWCGAPRALRGARRRRAAAWIKYPGVMIARCDADKKGHENMTDLTAADLDKATVEKAYDRWAPVYDLVFGAVFDRGRQAAIAAAERIGGRILEVGVGTGISLPDYSRANRICGIDISEAMLLK